MTTRITTQLLSTESATSAARPTLPILKAIQQAMWSAGDFAKIGVGLQIVGENLCESVDLRAGQRVLDVATGSGNTAIAAARRYTEVVGIDFVPALLERARQRATAELLEIEFREGDAASLPVADQSFDVVLSTFGAMFAADHERAARELLRACKPGGTIGLACWTPESAVGESGRLMQKYAPMPPGLEPPTSWGTERHLRKIFGPAVAEWRFERKSFTFRYRSFEHWLELFRTYFGPIQRTFALLDAAQQVSLTTELRELMLRLNRSGDATIVYPGEYLEVVLTKA